MKDREKFVAWWNAPEQAELRKSCAMGWAEYIWRAAQTCQHCGGSGWIRELGDYTSPEEIVSPCPYCKESENGQG